MHMPAGSVLHNEAAALAALQTAPEPEGGKEEDSEANDTKGVSFSSMLDPKPQMQRGRVQASLRRQNVAHAALLLRICMWGCARAACIPNWTCATVNVVNVNHGTAAWHSVA